MKPKPSDETSGAITVRSIPEARPGDDTACALCSALRCHGQPCRNHQPVDKCGAAVAVPLHSSCRVAGASPQTAGRMIRQS
jgi:hypothetical protein